MTTETTETETKLPSPTRRENWETISVIPLPSGWINVFCERGGTFYASPAPALLFQECTSERITYWIRGHEGRPVPCQRTEDCERKTRVVAGTFDLLGVEPANFYDTYHATLTEQQYESEWPKCEPGDEWLECSYPANHDNETTK